VSKPRYPKPRPIFSNKLSQAVQASASTSRYGLNSPNLTTPTHWQATTDTPSSGDSREGLPEFARSAWVSRFLPTLYAFLGSLERPWELSEQGSDDVKEIQKLVNIVYPGSGYKVKLNDRIFSMVIVIFRVTTDR
jgi:hypothetical protein